MFFMLYDVPVLLSRQSGVSEVLEHALKADFWDTRDMAIPLVGVGLLYKNGYFRQDIDADGRQVAQYPVNNFGLLPISMVYDADKQPVFVQLELPGRLLFARVWKLCVGRITLYLMDTDTRRNTDEDRRITDKLYEANREVRLLQEMLLGMQRHPFRAEHQKFVAANAPHNINAAKIAANDLGHARQRRSRKTCRQGFHTAGCRFPS